MNKSGVVERIEVQPDSLFFQEHVARYDFAKGYIQPGRLLDLACGTGYGCDLMQPICASDVFGMDIDQPALEQARGEYKSSTICFLSGSGTAIPFAGATFANITSMETIEHIADDHGFVRELARVLQENGVIVLTTPNRAYSERHGIVNPFHVREYYEPELLKLLNQYFGQVEIFHQGFGESFHERVKEYSQKIQEQKKHLNPVLRFVIDKIYRPLKKRIPARVTNFVIYRLLRVSYPQPQKKEIVISRESGEDCSNFVAVCHNPKG